MAACVQQPYDDRLALVAGGCSSVAAQNDCNGCSSVVVCDNCNNIIACGAEAMSLWHLLVMIGVD